MSVISLAISIFELISKAILSKVSEVKCVHCKEWTLWRGHVDDRCLNCGHFLDPQRFSREVEKKIRGEVVAEKDWLYIKPQDSPLKRQIKQSLNSVRWLAYYAQVAFISFISLIMLMLSFLAG